LLRRDQALVAFDAAIHAGKEGQTLLHRLRQPILEFLDVRHHRSHALVVEVQRLATSSKMPR
jgi:hypothetical protein